MAVLRGFQWSDLDGLLQVREAALPSAAGQRLGDRERLAADLERAGGQPERDLWVVEEGGQIVAYGRLAPWYDPRGLQVEIVVRPEQRGRGLGRALLRRLGSWAERRGSDFLAAVVDERVPEVGEFLRKQGFRVYVERQHMRLEPIRIPVVRPVGGYRLRAAGLEDAAVLAEVSNATFGERGGVADAEGYRRYLTESKVGVRVAEREADEAVAGLVETYGREVSIDGGLAISGHIASLAVRPEEQGRGLGHWLLAVGIGACSAAGWPSVELNVDCDNGAALHLYEWAGFRRVYGYAEYRRP